VSDTSPADGGLFIDLTEEIRSVVNGALSAGHPVAVAYVDTTGKPHLSMRGTVQVYGSDRLALWNRGPGLPDSVTANPQIALLYLDLAARTHLRFNGRARVETDPAIRDQIFEGSPVREQAQDPNRHGIAIIIDLDLVRGITPSGPVSMVRDV
jgi:Pyridoxamine 5'-phosphate oxidase